MSFNVPARCNSRWFSGCFPSALYIGKLYWTFWFGSTPVPFFLLSQLCLYTYFSCKTINFFFLTNFMQEQNYEFSITLQVFLPSLHISVLPSFAVAWQHSALIFLLCTDFFPLYPQSDGIKTALMAHRNTQQHSALEGQEMCLLMFVDASWV